MLLWHVGHAVLIQVLVLMWMVAQEGWHDTNLHYLVIQAMIVDFSFSYRTIVSQGSISLFPLLWCLTRWLISNTYEINTLATSSIINKVVSTTYKYQFWGKGAPWSLGVEDRHLEEVRLVAGFMQLGCGWRKRNSSQVKRITPGSTKKGYLE